MRKTYRTKAEEQKILDRIEKDHEFIKVSRSIKIRVNQEDRSYCNRGCNGLCAIVDKTDHANCTIFGSVLDDDIEYYDFLRAHPGLEPAANNFDDEHCLFYRRCIGCCDATGDEYVDCE